MPAKVIIDCDPGIDDALALLLTFASPAEIDLIGITCVAGNVPLAKTHANARRICLLAGREDVPVIAGCPRPLMSREGRTTTVHGADGLGDIGLPLPTAPMDASRHAVDFIIDQVLRQPGEITLCPIGPMTNIALALVKAPEIASHVKAIVFMGGAALCQGNVTPLAEFNFFGDPHAARIVLDAGIPLTMFGLDVTYKTDVAPGWVDALEALGNRSAVAAARMLRFYGTKEPYLHDPCVIASLIDPTLFSGIDAHISVVAEDSAQDGQVVARIAPVHLKDRKPNTRLMTAVDNDRLLALLHDRLAMLP